MRVRKAEDEFIYALISTMDIEHARWDEYYGRFTALAEAAERVPKNAYALDKTRGFLCLFGDNGLNPDDEFALLRQLEAAAADGGETLKKVEVDTAYWQDTVLFLP